MIEIITGDLLEAKEKYIAHITNCVSTGGAIGIAKSIFDKYPYANCYSTRLEHSKSGTIDIRGNGKNNRYIINMHAIVYPGRSKYPLSTLDGLAARRKYFYRALLRVASLPDLESIAFPWRIGCNLGGGDWEHYLGTLTNFAQYVGEKDVKVRVYRREGDE
jgi:O-acetyl-ADP-ribose deacetylase (regulator of RNase III)